MIHSELSCSQVHKVSVLCHIIFFLNIGLRKTGKLDYIDATIELYYKNYVIAVLLHWGELLFRIDLGKIWTTYIDHERAL